MKVKLPVSAGVNVAPLTIESSTYNLTVAFSTVILVGILLIDIVALLIVTLSKPS